jgi:opacity protein-like surface antigen
MMKKLLPVAVLAAGLMTAVPTQAQSLRFGFEGGLNVTKPSLSKDIFDTSNRLGFYVGPKLKFTLPIVGLGVDVAALYDHRESKLEAEAGDAKNIKQDNIVVPLNLRYNVGLGNLLGIYFFGGPQLGFNIGDKSFSWTDLSSYDHTFSLKKSNFSVNLGAGVTISHLEVSARYNIPITKTGNVTSVGQVAGDAITSITSKSNTWQVGLAYYF